MNLKNDYVIKEMSSEEFAPIWDKYASSIFDDNSQIFRLYRWLSEEEKNKCKELGKYLDNQYQLRLGIFVNGECVGWAAGLQESADTYYMRNSAILPEHRRKGLYTALLMKTIDILNQKGFQKIYSRHSATNNAVIIPKLKAGFVITSIEVTDLFGVLVHLTYYPNELRRKILTYRVGDSKPDDEIRKCLNI